MFMHEESPNLGFADIVIPNPLYYSHVFPMCSLPSHSPEYYIDTPIENPMIFNANVDLGYEVNLFSMLGGMLIILCPYVALMGLMPLLIHITCT